MIEILKTVTPSPRTVGDCNRGHEKPYEQLG